MGKKPQKHTWAEAKKLCRLNQQDIAMAQALGCGPDNLIRNRPDPKQRWKLPVKEWIHELHEKRFGQVLGEQPMPAPARKPVEFTEEEQRQIEEQFFWEDYWDRNDDPPPAKVPGSAGKPEPKKATAPPKGDFPSPRHRPDDTDVPF